MNKKIYLPIILLTCLCVGKIAQARTVVRVNNMHDSPIYVTAEQSTTRRGLEDAVKLGPKAKKAFSVKADPGAVWWCYVPKGKKSLTAKELEESNWYVTDIANWIDIDIKKGGKFDGRKAKKRLKTKTDLQANLYVRLPGDIIKKTDYAAEGFQKIIDALKNEDAFLTKDGIAYTTKGAKYFVTK